MRSIEWDAQRFAEDCERRGWDDREIVRLLNLLAPPTLRPCVAMVRKWKTSGAPSLRYAYVLERLFDTRFSEWMRVS